MMNKGRIIGYGMMGILGVLLIICAPGGALGDTWVTTTVDDSAGDVGLTLSLALDAAGHVHISYYDNTNKDLKYATNATGSWVTTTVDSTGDVGAYPSLALDAYGHVCISYYDNTNGYLKYADNALGYWVTTIVDSSAGYVGLMTSLAFDPITIWALHISYFDYTNRDLKYVTTVSGSWVFTTLDSAGDVGWFTSLALDAAGHVHISYYDNTNKDLKYATNATGSWVTTTVDSTGDVGEWTSLALDASGHCHISYYDVTNGDLKYATNASGSWVYTTVDNTLDVGACSSLALDADGYFHISYYDGTNGDLKYATNAGGYWVTTTVDSAGDVGWYTSLALDAAGHVHISYYDHTNGDLKYATNVPLPDTTPPTPNPMTWATSPSAASATAISMTAATATDAGSPPVSYYFAFAGSPTGGTGGADSGWQSSTFYANFGLQPNHQYGYQVKARDSAPTHNETSLSSPVVYKYTRANAPVAASFSNITQTSIQANWTTNGNSAGTRYYCENTTKGTNSGWTTNTYWPSSGLTCETSYSFLVKAKNGDGVETTWTNLGSQATQGCGEMLPPVINDISDDSVLEGTPYTGPTPTLSKGTLPVTWSLVTCPSTMGIDSDSGVVSWANPTLSGSPYTITIEAKNTVGSDTVSWQLTVTPIPDSSPPTPNPMTWATPPSAASATSISMTATTATDAGSPPVAYYFAFVSGGSGGADSGWQSSTSYTNSGLQPNQQYSYHVKARDSASTPNETSWSSTLQAYTLANVPGAASFSNITETSMQANWTDGGNPSGTQYYCENTTKGTNSGWTTTTSWNSSGLTCNTSYSFRVKAKNGDGTETGWTNLGSQATQPCPGVLSITPSEDLSSSGYQGGPFDPLSKDYVLTNTGGVAIDWTAATTQDWVTLSATSGTLDPGTNTTVTVSIKSTANSLFAGTYNDTVTFTNTTNGTGNTTRGVALTINTPPLGWVLYVTTSPNPLIMDIMADRSLGVNTSATIPADMSAYDLVIVSSTEACSLEQANYLKTYLALGGGVILTAGTPAYLASASPGGSTDDLSAITDWLGAGTYGTVGASVAHLSYNYPFGTGLLQGAAIGACESSGGAIRKDTLSATSDIIAAWDFDSNSVFSFTHAYGKGRVYYTGEEPQDTYEEASTGFFDGAVAWVISTTATHILHKDGAIWSSDTGWTVTTPPYYPTTGYARALKRRTDSYVILHKDGAIYDSVNNWNLSSPPYYPGTNYAVDLKVTASGETIILHKDGALWSSTGGWTITSPPYYPGTAYAQALEVRGDASYVILHKDGAIYDSASDWVVSSPPYYPTTNYAVDMKLNGSAYVILHRDGALWSSSSGWIVTVPPYYPGTDYARALELVGDGYKILHRDGAIYDSATGWVMTAPPYYPGTNYAVDLEIR